MAPSCWYYGELTWLVSTKHGNRNMGCGPQKATWAIRSFWNPGLLWSWIGKNNSKIYAFLHDQHWAPQVAIASDSNPCSILIVFIEFFNPNLNIYITLISTLTCPYLLPNIFNIFHCLMQYCTCLVFIFFWDENFQVSIFTEKLPLHRYHENILHVAFLTKIKQLSLWMFIQLKETIQLEKMLFQMV